MGSYRSRSIYQLHIQLVEIEPAIWRRISVPGKISLARLHRLLQLAMGWENYHLYLFMIGEVLYGESDPEYPIRASRSSMTVMRQCAMCFGRRRCVFATTTTLTTIGVMTCW